MCNFKKINSKDNIKDIIKSAFNTEIEVDGSWGYTQELSTIIKENNKEIEFMLATMRANLEMNMTLSEEKRYSSINLHEIKRENNKNEYFTKVLYQITAMKEKDYKKFIQEYKNNHLKKDFDLQNHFTLRKKATIKREVVHWFKYAKKSIN